MTSSTNPSSKSRFKTKRIARILLGLAVGAVLGWSLAGLYSGRPALETPAHALVRTSIDPSSSTTPPTELVIAPDSQATWIAGHLLAAIAGIFFAGLVVGLLTGDNSKEPMEIAAKEDAH
jgi:hypothetical protein